MKKLQSHAAAIPYEAQIPKLLPPSDDRVFKLLLTHGDAGPILKDVIAAIIGRKVRKVFVRNNEIPVDDVHAKQERLDVNCVTADGEQIDLEMQSSRVEEAMDSRHVNLKRKSLFYLCDLYSSQSIRGKSYSDLARTWQVTFCAYNIFPGDGRYFRAATLRDEEGKLLMDDITMAFVELPKAADLSKKPVSELTSLDMWTLFFGYAHRSEYHKVMGAIFKKKKEVDMAGTLLKSISKDERERAVLRSRRMFQTDMESNRITAERRGIKIGEERGEKRGEERGIKIGEERGIKIGEERGEKRRDADRKEAARILLAKGLSLDIIAEATKLTLDEIKRLENPQGKSRAAARKPSKR